MQKAAFPWVQASALARITDSQLGSHAIRPGWLFCELDRFFATSFLASMNSRLATFWVRRVNEQKR